MMKPLCIMLLTSWLAAAQNQTPQQIYANAPNIFPWLPNAQGLYEITPNTDENAALSLIIDHKTINGNKGCLCYEADGGLAADQADAHCPGTKDTGLKFGVFCIAKDASGKWKSLQVTTQAGTMQEGIPNNQADPDTFTSLGLVLQDNKVSIGYRQGSSSSSLTNTPPNLKKTKRPFLGCNPKVDNKTLETSVVMFSGTFQILAYHSKYFGPLNGGLVASKAESWDAETKALLPIPVTPVSTCTKECVCDVETKLAKQEEPPKLAGAAAVFASASLIGLAALVQL